MELTEERAEDHRLGITDPKLVHHQLPVGLRSLRGDPIYHAVREGYLLLDSGSESFIPQLRERDERPQCHVALVLRSRRGVDATAKMGASQLSYGIRIR